jgi:quercetin dioxygenase-like cupin family protein
MPTGSEHMDTTDGLAAEVQVETVAETPQLRMVVLTVAAGQEVPWHFHSDVTDTFFCMQGPMVIQTRQGNLELSAGEMGTVPARRAHRVSGRDGGPCKFALLQGVGTYDFNVADPASED